jgi:monoamine oxidase
MSATALSAIARNSDGRYTLDFGTGRTSQSVTADQVILALPFSKLREVDYSKAGFVEPKTLAIKEMPIGANAKLRLQFSNRHWRALGNNGDSYADTGYQDTWEVSRAQAGASGLLVNYTGGDTTRSQAGGSPQQLGQRFLGQIGAGAAGLEQEVERQGYLRLLAQQCLDERRLLLLARGPVHPFCRRGVSALQQLPLLR